MERWRGRWGGKWRWEGVEVELQGGWRGWRVGVEGGGEKVEEWRGGVEGGRVEGGGESGRVEKWRVEGEGRAKVEGVEVELRGGGWGVEGGGWRVEGGGWRRGEGGVEGEQRGGGKRMWMVESG